VGPFYPPGMKPADFLSYYATQFGVVEADVTYYRVPGPDLVRGWASKVPAGFQICAKFPRSVVHCGAGPLPDPTRILRPDFVRSDTEQFLAAMGLLGDKCGPLVLQFPYFNRRVFADPQPFFERLERYLDGLPAGFRYAVELRNRDWITPQLTALLARRRCALVLADLPYMPLPHVLARSVDIASADFYFVRLIGDRKATEAHTTKFDRVVLDRSAALLRWADFLRPLVGRGEEVYVFANNHFAGHGPTTIRELAGMIDGPEDPPAGA
jgi:uncharacterized protein YecE (DUF72 family)